VSDRARRLLFDAHMGRGPSRALTTASSLLLAALALGACNATRVGWGKPPLDPCFVGGLAVPVEPRIEACTRLIAKGGSNDDLAAAYAARADAYLWHIGAARKSRHAELAIADYTEAIRLRPRDPDLYLARARAYEGLERWGDAIADYTAALELKPDYFDALLLRGLAYEKINAFDRALMDYNRAIEIGHENIYMVAGARNSRIKVFYKMGAFERMLPDLDEIIRVDPRNYEALNDRCFTRAILNRDLDRALADCNAALDILGNYAPVLNSRGFVYFRRGEYDKAIADYNAALSRDGKDASSFFMRGICKRRLGDEAGAHADIEGAKALDPGIAARYARFGVTG